MRIFSCAVLGCALLMTGCKKPEAIEMLRPSETPASLQKYWAVPDFILTATAGAPLRLADLAGKVWVADFFYASCPGPCPVVSSHVEEVQKALGSRADVRLVSISVDPGSDTVDVLKDYAKKYHAGPNWFFCTGDKKAIYSLAHDGFKLPIADGTPESGPIAHTTRLILVDRYGTVRGFYEGTTEEGVQALIHDAQRLLEER